jgi:Resolvase, N terminal domain
VVAAREFGKRSTLRPSPSGLGLLRRRQFRRTAHALPALLRPAAAFGGTGADKIALHVGEAAQHGDHQPPGAGAGVAQLEQLRGACCAKIYREKVTGAHSDRRELLKMLKSLTPGDVVTVTRIDRLARSTFDLFAIVKQIVDAKAQFRSLASRGPPRGRKSAARTLGRFRFAARRLRCRRRAWRRGNGPAKHLDSIPVSIKLTQCHYVCDGGILAFLIETVFAARIEACRSILGNDLSQCGYSPLMSGDYDASAHFGVSISHTINMGAREAGRHGK